MANPTTNYSWPMPTTTDLVTDLPADFAAFGQPVDTSLKALNPETTLGDIAYRSSTANTNTRLAIGSTGQVLTVAAGVPAWGAAPSGKVIQVIGASLSTSVSTTSGTYADSGLTVNITPTLNTSKVLVQVSLSGWRTSGVSGASCTGRFNIYRGGQLVETIVGAGGLTFTSGAVYSCPTLVFLDSPASTSALTYKVQYLTDNGTTYFNITSIGATASIVVSEIGA